MQQLDYYSKNLNSCQPKIAFGPTVRRARPADIVFSNKIVYNVILRTGKEVPYMTHSKTGIRAAILAMSVVQMGTNAISPILADIAAAFPQAGASTVQFLMTFPSLMVLVFSLAAAGAAAYIPKKVIAAAGCGLFCAGGVLSWLFHGSLTLLFVWAGTAGIGIGLVVPMATSLVTDCFEGAEQQSVMGLQSSAANVGAMLMTFFGGLLAAVHWSCNYLVYLIALPGLFLALACLPKNAGQTGGRTAGGGFLTLLKKPAVLAACALSLLVTMLFNTAPTNLSMLVTENGLGTAAQAGTATTLLLLSGTAGGLLFGKLAGKLGRRVMAFGFGMMALGQLICAAAPSLPAVFAGCLVCGCAISTVMPQVTLDAAAHADGNAAGTAALVMASSNLGGFCAPVLTMASRTITGSDATAPRFILSAACALFIAAAIVLPVGKKK